MNLSNYMSTIMSEVQQFGKAYVDSLVSLSDGKDHETFNGPLKQKKNRKNGEVEEEDLEAPHFSPISCGRNVGAVNDGRSNDKGNTIGCTSSSGNSNSNSEGVFVSYSHPSPVVVDDATTTNTNTTNVPEAAVLSTEIRKNIGKKTKASKSKFGAVKIELESAEKPSVIPTSSTHIQTSHEPDPLNDKKNNHKSKNSECLRKSQEIASLKDISINKKLNIWFKKRDTLLHLLYTDLDKRVRPPISGWAQNVLRDFVKKIIGTSLNSIMEEDNNTVNKETVSTSIDNTLEDAWRNSEIIFRSIVKHAIPPEVFAPTEISQRDISTNSVIAASFEGSSWIHQALLNTIQRAQQWGSEGRLKILLLPLSEDNIESGMKDYLDSCYAPLLFLTAEHCRKWIQSHLPLQEIENETDRELEIWAEAMMRVFCVAVVEADVQAQELALSVTADNRETAKMCVGVNTCVDAAEAAVENTTSALWLMREVTVLTLLLVRVLRIGLLCEVEQ
ncbi:hypothetical protein LSM04_003647 [Trypanosoma melophagium]|uniref:uncharacterized protein n=1 Tax=Trypanosoma melophagium TaxID=715481 RepID=UPI00351A6BD8|nr:hypothetical protein LSM04_003647 [Trypanosoma melophagium]